MFSVLSRRDEEASNLAAWNDWARTADLDIAVVAGSLIAFVTLRGAWSLKCRGRAPDFVCGALSTVCRWVRRKSNRFVEFVANELTWVGHWVRMGGEAVF